MPICSTLGPPMSRVGCQRVQGTPHFPTFLQNPGCACGSGVNQCDRNRSDGPLQPILTTAAEGGKNQGRQGGTPGDQQLLWLEHITPEWDLGHITCHHNVFIHICLIRLDIFPTLEPYHLLPLLIDLLG